MGVLVGRMCLCVLRGVRDEGVNGMQLRSSIASSLISSLVFG